MDKNDVTIIICCAGMGTRLGIGTTKSLIKIDGKSIIERELDLLRAYDDIRIVVGFQAEEVIKEVNKIRNDIMFVFNNDYKNTGPADSVNKALRGARKYVVIVDGDLLINRADFEKLLAYPNECIAVCYGHSYEPIYVSIENEKVIDINETSGNGEWSCVTKVLSKRIGQGKGGIHEVIRPLLPLDAVDLRVRDLDTQDDFERMIDWYRSGCA